jgi:hypothetical protein
MKSGHAARIVAPKSDQRAFRLIAADLTGLPYFSLVLDLLGLH